MKLSSTVLKEGHKIPLECTCDDKNSSPPLFWSEVPEEAKSLALICEDLDAYQKFGPTGLFLFQHILKVLMR